ncbi:Ribosomal protein S18 acetylase RimI [Actinopolymorpha cephalotaxi]|uniref:GNAT superfamily N-acetyltransferase n=1 Tax=Actinopolymorpha cephalotaxi TaxID=504797 RepID=A0A1I2X0A8_9ACTN|nr:GNAT family N-acetyltransferase [Actinopolymorpha cephalotaxi]NYH85200.1 GNAT superfamily N-acetyltransferase [Actinopolymorpha cephalotaxi]SFH06309.1 Ribosomal protein S18 acetylase RimI [Actinopolymorpha cephalotaxi]
MGTIHTGVVKLPLTVRDMTEADLPELACFYPGHVMATMPAELERARTGVVDHLVVCTPAGVPVAKGAVNWDEIPGAGVISTLSVRAELRSIGIGTVLIQASEERMRARGLSRSEIGAEENNPRARALYERLGYVVYGCEPASWDEEKPDGTLGRYETTCTLLRKDL